MIKNRFDSKLRFSDRAQNYHKYRPLYPSQLLDYLEEVSKVLPEKVAADIGAGTGIFSKHLLSRGWKVHGVEPNKEMRRIAEDELSKDGDFFSVQGEAENTLLPDSSISLVTCAQSFHWFADQKTAWEFKRILKPKGKILLVWNRREISKDSFNNEYDALLRTYCKDYEHVHNANVNMDSLRELFPEANIEVQHFPNFQYFDLEGLLGRLESSSYTPKPEDEEYMPLVEGVTKIYSRYQRAGRIDFKYDSEAFLITP